MQGARVEEFVHGGRTMLVHRLGEAPGPSFVLVHGIGVGSTYLRPLARALAGFGRVHLLELPGMGAAPRPARPMSVEDFAAIVSAHLLDADVRDPVLIGHSMGTQIVIEASLRHPERFRRLVLMGTVVDPEERTALRQSLRLLEDSMVESPSANAAVFADYFRTGVRWYLATLPAMLGYRTEEALTHVTADLVIMRGGRDPISRPGWTERLRRIVPGARFVEVPGRGHAVMFAPTDAVAAPIAELAGVRWPRGEAG